MKTQLDTECLIWITRFRDNGKRRYINISNNGKSQGVHRVAWEDANQASILPGFVVMHLCDNPRCINPKHLRLGTHAENITDRDQKGRHVSVKGEQNFNSKLTDLQVKALRAFKWSDVVAQKDLAQFLNVTQTAVSYHLKSKASKSNRRCPLNGRFL